MVIKFFDMFAGIGGFRSGFEAIGGFECVGYCEIDKYAMQIAKSNYPDIQYIGDAYNVRNDDWSLEKYAK